jgi:hypothetical protein
MGLLPGGRGCLVFMEVCGHSMLPEHFMTRFVCEDNVNDVTTRHECVNKLTNYRIVPYKSSGYVDSPPYPSPV